MTRDEFFTALENGAKWDIGVAINRTNPVPIDASSVFKTLSDLQTYAETNPVAHPGQLVAVIGEDEVAAYIITSTGSGAVVQKLAASSASGDLTQDILDLQQDIAEILNGTQVVGQALKATQDGEGNVISETYAKNEVATTDTNGLMSSADKSKLDGIEAGAEVNVIEGVAVKTTSAGEFTPVSVQDKIAQVDLSQFDTDITALEGRMDTAESDIAELQTTIGGLSGAMHFVGSSSTDPTEGPTIEGHQGEYQSGDVCLYDGKEYIYDGSTWQEFGNEGDHLTKEVADTYYVPLTRTVNGKPLSENITLGAGDVGADAAGTAAAAIQALDVEAIQLGAGETLSSISETDGKIAAEKQSIQIEISQVTNLQTTLDSKLEEDDLPTSFDIAANSEDFAVQGGANSVTINIKESASPVEGQLTKNLDGSKLDFGGQISANGTILTGNQGTVISITAGEGLTTGGAPITESGTISLESIGAASQSTSNEGRNYIQNITVDDYGRVTAVSSGEVPDSVDTNRQINIDGVQLLDTSTGKPLNIVAGKNITLTPNTEEGSVTITAADAPVYTGESGVVTVADNLISIAAGGIGTDKIADGAITNEKIASVDVAKLFVAENDTFILNGGNA